MWRVSALHAILHNEVYTGRQIWNRSKWVKDPDTGKRTAIARPRSEWIVNERPDLALVDAETWHRVRTRRHDRLSLTARPAALPIERHPGLRPVRPEHDDCRRWNGSKECVRDQSRRGRCRLLEPSGVPRLVAEELILEPVDERFVSDRAIKEMVNELYRIKSGQLTAPASRPVADPRIAELRKLVKTGVLSEAEARPAIARLEAEEAKPATLPDVARLARTLEARAKAYREALHGKAVSVARDVLRRLVGSVRCVPVAVAGAKGGGYLMGHFDQGTTRPAAARLVLSRQRQSGGRYIGSGGRI